MNVPFLDLKAVNVAEREALTEAFTRVLDSGWYVLGEELEAFEAEFAQYCGVKHCVGIASGLDALQLLLSAYGIGPGDEVIVPSNTFIATWLAVTHVGAKPIPVEPDQNTYNISPSLIEEAISTRTKAIITVHLYGQPADMDAINAVANNYGIIVLEDAAQAQGAGYKWRPVGSLGHAAATSFYPGKNLGALGDGGAALTNDSAIAVKVRKLRNYGSVVKHQHEYQGFNSRLDELQAAFLRIKLRGLDDANSRRREIANLYFEGLKNSGVQLPFVPDWADPVWHLYVVRTSERDRLQMQLRQSGVETIVHYPRPPHLQKCYINMDSFNLPIAEQLAAEVLSLPISPVMQDHQVDWVINQIFVKQH